MEQFDDIGPSVVMASPGMMQVFLLIMNIDDDNCGLEQLTLAKIRNPPDKSQSVKKSTLSNARSMILLCLTPDNFTLSNAR